MNTSYPRKCIDLAGALARTPRHWWSYLKWLPVWGREPLDLELPWFAFDAISFLDSYLQPQHQAFEFGAGGSSFYLARRVQSLTTMESHAEWHSRIEALVQAKRVTNLRCELHPLDDGKLDGYRDSPFFQRINSGMWDVVVIDCFCGFSDGSYGQLRRHAFDLALKRVKAGGIIILDDSWLYPDLLAPRPGWTIRDYIGPGPCRYGVTSTAVFQRSPAI